MGGALRYGIGALQDNAFAPLGELRAISANVRRIIAVGGALVLEMMVLIDTTPQQGGIGRGLLLTYLGADLANDEPDPADRPMDLGRSHALAGYCAVRIDRGEELS
jgi:hypothetical protein